MVQINPHAETYVLSLKVDELKQCLRHLGKPLTGRKADLQERILALIRAGRAQPNFEPSVSAIFTAQQAGTLMGRGEGVLVAWVRECARARSVRISAVVCAVVPQKVLELVIHYHSGHCR